MAKYSRRGIISNFLVYTLSIVFEQTLLQQYKTWVLILTLGLLLATVWRGYLLFRMDSIYPRGPTAWRNKYFLATLVGAAWWGLILSSFTLLLSMKAEATLLWLYTVVFFATTAHAFAPYQRFLSVYQFLGLVPAAACTFLVGELIGVFYGFILLFFYWVLNHQSELMSRNYWDRLEVHYKLARKTESLEEEKRDTRASVQLSKEYLQVLGKKMHKLLHSDGNTANTPSTPVSFASQRAMFEGIYRNVDDFQRILTKDFSTEEHVFNVRHYIQSLVKELLEEAESKSVELESTLSPALPSRLIGDSKRVGQVITTAVRSVLQQHNEGVVIVEVEFMRTYENAGELNITVARQGAKAKRSFFQNEVSQSLELNLDLVLAKGIAEVLGGSLEVDESGAKDGKDVRLKVPLGVAEMDARPEYHRLEYKGRQLMLIHHNPRWLDHKRLELDTMGFEVRTVSRFKKGVQELIDAVAAGMPFELVVYYVAPGDDASVQFCNELISNNELKNVHQFVVCSELGKKFFSERAVTLTPMVHFVDRPAGFFEFDVSFSAALEYEPNRLNSAQTSAGSADKGYSLNVLWVALGKNFDNTKFYDNSVIDICRAGEARQIAKYLEAHTFDVAIVEYSGSDKLEGISAIRQFERSHNREALIPIIGVGPREAQHEMLAFGADHVMDVESLLGGDTRTLLYWAQGRQL